MSKKVDSGVSKFLEYYDKYWKGTEFDTPEWRDFWIQLVRKESSFIPTAHNKEGAYGYFQLMPFNRYNGTSVEAQFKDTLRLARSFQEQMTKVLSIADLKRAKEIGLTNKDLLRGAWLGGLNNVKKALNGANPKDSNGTGVWDYLLMDSDDEDDEDYEYDELEEYPDDYSDLDSAIAGSLEEYPPPQQEEFVFEKPNTQNNLYEDERDEQLLQNLSVINEQQQVIDQLQKENQLAQQALNQNNLLTQHEPTQQLQPEYSETSQIDELIQDAQNDNSTAQQILSSLWSQPREDFAFTNNPLLQDKEDLALAYQTAQDKMIANGGHLHEDGGDKEIVPTGTIDKLTLRGNNPFNVWRGSQYLTPQYTPERDYIAYSNGENIWRVPLEKIYPVNDDDLTPQQRLERDWRKSPTYGIDKVILGTLAGTMAPFAVAEAAPALAGLATGASDAAMATRAGQAVYQGLTSPVGKAALSSVFGGMGMHNFFSDNGYKKTLQEWENLLNDPSYYNAVNFGKSALGDAMDVTMMAPLYKPLTYMGKEAWNAGRQGVEGAWNLAAQQGNNYARARQLSKAFDDTIDSFKGIDYAQEPSHIRNVVGNSNITKLPITYSDSGNIQINPNFYYRSGWGIIDDAIKTGRVRVPEGNYKKAALEKYPWLDNGNPFSTTLMNHEFPYFSEGELWPTMTKLGKEPEDLIAIPNDIPGVKWVAGSKFGSLVRDASPSQYGGRATPLIDEYTNMFPTEKALLYRLNPETGRYELHTPNLQEPPTLSWEEATAPKITEENTTSIVNKVKNLIKNNADTYDPYDFPNMTDYVRKELYTTPQQAIMEGQQKALDYLGSERHIQQIMKSGKTRQEATEIANQMNTNALRALGNAHLEELGERTGGFYNIAGIRKDDSAVKKALKVTQALLGKFEPTFSINKNRSIHDIIEATMHEFGGHGATLGYIDTSDNVLASGLFRQYNKKMREWFPKAQEVYKYNASLKPIRKPEYKNSRKRYLKYLEDVDEYSTRARVENMQPGSEGFDAMYKYFTKESVDRLRDNVWGIAPWLIGIGAAGTLYGTSQQGDSNVQAYGVH